MDTKQFGLRSWPFRVTWRHRSRDHSIPRWPFPIGAPMSPSVYSHIRANGKQTYRGHDLDLSGLCDVNSHVTIW